MVDLNWELYSIYLVASPRIVRLQQGQSQAVHAWGIYDIVQG